MDAASTMPVRPADFAMPQTAQAIFTFGNALPLLVIAVLAIGYARRNRTAVPLAMLAGGLICALMEPVVDILGLCQFPERDAWVAFRAFGVAIPAYMLPVYCWFVGGQAFLIWSMLRRGMTPRGMIRLWLILILVNGLLETPGLLIGVYRYYGAQPFSLLGFPWWWPLCNATMPITAAVLVWRLGPWLVGWRTALIVPLLPMADGLTNGAIGWPVWLALNSGLGYAATVSAALVSLGLAWLMLRVLILVATSAPRAAMASGGIS